MLVLAAIEWTEILPGIIGILGLGGIVFTALRFRRDDTTAVVNQQDTIMKEFKTLNDELRTATEAMRNQRDACHQEVSNLRRELRSAKEMLSGQMTDIQEKLDE
jgi:hypothetical protein